MKIFRKELVNLVFLYSGDTMKESDIVSPIFSSKKSLNEFMKEKNLKGAGKGPCHPKNGTYVMTGKAHFYTDPDAKHA